MGLTAAGALPTLARAAAGTGSAGLLSLCADDARLLAGARAALLPASAALRAAGSEAGCAEGLEATAGVLPEGSALRPPAAWNMDWIVLRGFAWGTARGSLAVLPEPAVNVQVRHRERRQHVQCRPATELPTQSITAVFASVDTTSSELRATAAQFKRTCFKEAGQGALVGHHLREARGRDGDACARQHLAAAPEQGDGRLGYHACCGRALACPGHGCALALVTLVIPIAAAPAAQQNKRQRVSAL